MLRLRERLTLLQNSLCHIAVTQQLPAAPFRPQPDLTRPRLGLDVTRLSGVDLDCPRLVTDFLDFVYEKFPFLNPYEKLALCKHNKKLLNNRCKLAMESITPGAVDYQKNWGYYMKFDGGPSQLVKLDAEEADAEFKLLLSVHPGDTQAKAKQLYKALSVERLSQLQAKKGWQVEPNFHLAFMQQGLCRSKGTVSLSDYVAFWLKNRDLIHQWPVGPESEVQECFKKYVAVLARVGIISENEIARVFKETIQTNRTTINVCPGLSLFYRWQLSNAVDLDKRGAFVDDVRARLQEAFDAWGQKI